MITQEEIVEKVRESLDTAPGTEIPVDELDAMEFRLSYAIREGSGHTEQAYHWGANGSACALKAAEISAQARGYVN